MTQGLHWIALSLQLIKLERNLQHDESKHILKPNENKWKKRELQKEL